MEQRSPLFVATPLDGLQTPCLTSTSAGPSTLRTEIASDVLLFTMLEKNTRQLAEMQETLNQVLGIVKTFGWARWSKLHNDFNLPVSTNDEVGAIQVLLQDTNNFNGLLSLGAKLNKIEW